MYESKLSKQQLTELGANALAEMLMVIHENSLHWSQQIDEMILRYQPDSLKIELSRRTVQLTELLQQLTYRQSKTFSCTIDELIDDIAQLLPDNSVSAFELMEQLLIIAKEITIKFVEVPGHLLDSIERINLLWLDCASLLNEEDDDIWIERIYQISTDEHNEYFSTLLTNADRVLSKPQLEQLAWQYEKNLRKAINERNDQHEQIKQLRYNLRNIAKALADGKLMERSFTIGVDYIKRLDKQYIAEFYLQIDEADSALQILTDNTEELDYNDLKLLDTIYEQLNWLEEQLEIRQQLFESHPSKDNFNLLLEMYPPEKHPLIEEKVIAYAMQSEELEVGLSLLLDLSRLDIAEELLLAREQELVECVYITPYELIEKFTKEQRLLPQIVCYRYLLTTALEQSDPSQYLQAAKYYLELVQLDKNTNDYQQLGSHYDYSKQLEHHHKNKILFWKNVTELEAKS